MELSTYCLTPEVVLIPSLLCMQDGHCSKKYPKQYISETQLGADSYPLYKRSSSDSGGHVSTISMRIGGSQGPCIMLDIII